MTKKWLTIPLCASMVFSALAGCSSSGSSAAPASSGAASSSAAVSQSGADPASGGSAEETSLRFMWWGGESRHKATVEAMDLYMQNHPGVKVEYEYGGFSGYFDKLLTQLAGNNAPDIVQLSYTNVNEYVVRDQLEALDSYIDGGILDVSHVNKTLLDTYNINDQYYAIPSGVNVQLLYYNKTMFDRFGVAYPTSGMTLDEYYAKAKEITDAARAAGENDVWGMEPYNNAFDVNFQRILIDFGGTLWTDDLSAPAFNSPEGIAAMNYVKKPLDEGYAVPPEVTVSNPDGVTDFVLGHAAMRIDNATSAPGYAATIDFDMGMELSPFGNNRKAIWYQASQVFSITKQSKHPEIAADVINYIINDPEAGKILGYERGIPVNDEIRAASMEGKSDVEIKELELVNGAEEYTGDGIPQAFPAGYLEIHTEFERLQQTFMYGEATAEQTMKDLESFAVKTMSKFQ